MFSLYHWPQTDFIHQVPIQKDEKNVLLCTELAAQRTGMLFEQRLNVLKNLKTLWSSDTDVAIVHVDENQIHFFIGSNDEVLYLKVKISFLWNECCDTMVLQDRNIV